MAFYENVAERVAGIGLGCAWMGLFGGGAEAGMAAAVAATGLAAVISDQIGRHGPESKQALKAIRRKIADDLEALDEIERWDRSADIKAADEALGRALQGCFLDRQALAASARSPERFPGAATALILTELARKEPLFAETGSATAREFAELVIRTALSVAIDNQDYFKGLQPHLILEILHGQGLLLEQVRAIPEVTARRTIDLMQEQGFIQLAKDRGLSQAQIENVLDRFGKTGLPPENWEQALLDSAAQLQDLQSRLSALSNDEPEIAALLQAAGAAIKEGAFDRADALLGEAEARDLEAGCARLRRAAESRVQRGELAQGLKDHWTAGEHFLEAARIVQGQDPEYWASCQHEAGNAFDDHGQLFPGPALDRAVTAYRAALEVRTRDAIPADWAGTQNNLGNTLLTQGQRASGAAGLALLGQSVEAYRAALEVYTRDSMPAKWAMTQSNLGNTLRVQGQRTDGAPGLALLGQSVDAFRAALEVCTRDAMRVDWAGTQNNLGNTLRVQGERTGGAAGLALLGQSEDAHRAALEVFTRDAMPAKWAMTQNNLGNTLSVQGERTGGTAGLALLSQSVDAYRAALEVRTQDAMPVDWAMTQNNLGNTLRAQGEHTGGAAGLALVGQSKEAYHVAMEVFTRDAMPANWARTQENIALAEVAWFELGTDRDALVRAREAAEGAMAVYREGGMAFYEDKCARLLARITALGG